MDTEPPADLQVIYSPIREEMRELSLFLNGEFSGVDPCIGEILRHIARFRGKQIRPALLLLVAKLASGRTTREHTKIAAVIELIHTATLVHDDILDDAMLRRRVETVHRRWGERAAVLIGDFIYSRAFHLSTEVPGMASILSDTTHTICEGELLQIGHRFHEVDEATYFEIVRKKTAILYAVSCQIGGLLSGLDQATCRGLYDFGMEIGTAFQIVDDCLDYTGTESVTGKSLGTDLRQGKMTLPLICLWESAADGERRRLREILRTPLSAPEEKWVHDLIKRYRSAAEAFVRAEAFTHSGKALLAAALDGDPTVAEIRESLERVADYVIRRRR